MKAVMISIQPKWCELIANGEKTIEVRKTRPKIDTPFKCYIYCTVSGATKNCSENEKGRKNLLIDYCWDSILDDRQVITQDLKGRRQLGKHTTHAFNYGTVLNGKVIGEFVCDRVDTVRDNSTVELEKGSCLTNAEIVQYANPENYVVRNRLCLTLYAWYISDLKIYDEPKELEEFYSYAETKRQGYKYCKRKGCLSPEDCKYYCISKNCCWRLTKPPQSWQYCEELEEK